MDECLRLLVTFLATHRNCTQTGYNFSSLTPFIHTRFTVRLRWQFGIFGPVRNGVKVSEPINRYTWLKEGQILPLRDLYLELPN